MMLGGIFLVMTMVGASLMKNPPAGYRPKHLSQKSTSGVAVPEYQFSPGEVLRTPAFYLLWLGFGLGSSAGLLIISQLVPFARRQGIPRVAFATSIESMKRPFMLLRFWLPSRSCAKCLHDVPTLQVRQVKEN